MPDEFDPYQQWLGIARHEPPPNFYRLLGVGELMDDVDAIGNAADRQMNFVRTFQLGKHRELSQKILRELAEAKICLLNPASKAAYDESLRAAKRSQAPVNALAASPAPPSHKPIPPPLQTKLDTPRAVVPPPAPPEPTLGEFIPAEASKRPLAVRTKSQRAVVPQWIWIGLAVVMTLVVAAWVIVRISGDTSNADVAQGQQQQEKPPQSEVSDTPSVAQNIDGSVNLLAALAVPEGTHAKSITQNGETFVTGLESLDDGLVWPFLVEKGQRGVFRVVVEYACPPGAEGGEFTVSVNDRLVKGTHTVRSTGGETNFLRVEIGFIKVQNLDSNVLRVRVKSLNKSHTNIMNVRSVRLQLQQSGKG